MNSTQGHEEGKRKKKFQIQIISSACKRCGICVAFCAKEVFSAAEDGEVKVVNPDSCTGCMLCELRCPDYALEVIPRENP
jgi:2-oxoglutarate ferredoxin oxidoreductase subunit delta